jgi:hypothetical protein
MLWSLVSADCRFRLLTDHDVRRVAETLAVASILSFAAPVDKGASLYRCWGYPWLPIFTSCHTRARQHVPNATNRTLVAVSFISVGRSSYFVVRSRGPGAIKNLCLSRSVRRRGTRRKRHMDHAAMSS